MSNNKHITQHYIVSFVALAAWFTMWGYLLMSRTHIQNITTNASLFQLQPTQEPILPPVQYDRPYEGDLTINVVATAEELRDRCKIQNLTTLGCAFPREKSCVIYLVEDSIMRRRGWHMGILLRHEIGHCNGWPGDHPNARSVLWPVTQ